MGTTLYKTEPHFIRCVVPNTHKQPGGVESALVMHQYQCNGVLAGIAICRAGFPNKMTYPEFKTRYNIIAAQLVAKAKNDKVAANGLLEHIKLDKEKYRLGHTKVFFRAGILGFMEEVREDRIGSVLAWLQAGARGKASRMSFKKLQDQKLALYCCQRTIRNWFIGKTWKWWHIWLAQKNEVALALSSGGSAVQDIIDKTTRIENMANDVQKQVQDVQKRIKGEQDQKQNIEQQMMKVNSQISQLQGEVSNMEKSLEAAEQEKGAKDDQIRTLKDEISHQSDMLTKLSKEKKSGTEFKQKTEEDIQAMEDKCNHLSRVKGKLEQALDEAEDALEREKKVKNDVEKLKRKCEGDMKLTQESVTDLERVKNELAQGLARKEKEYSALLAKIEDESSLGSKYQKQIKELQARLEELDEELNIERGNRTKAEKGRSMLKKDIEDIASRLEEAGANTGTQVELNKKREMELANLRA